MIQNKVLMEIRCDDCYYSCQGNFNYDGHSKETAKMFLKSRFLEGWKVVDEKYHLCPTCSKKLTSG